MESSILTRAESGEGSRTTVSFLPAWNAQYGVPHAFWQRCSTFKSLIFHRKLRMHPSARGFISWAGNVSHSQFRSVVNHAERKCLFMCWEPSLRAGNMETWYYILSTSMSLLATVSSPNHALPSFSTGVVICIVLPQIEPCEEKHWLLLLKEGAKLLWFLQSSHLHCSFIFFFSHDAPTKSLLYLKTKQKLNLISRFLSLF